MLKIISTALLAVSVLAAPAMAAGIEKTAPAPVTKTAPATKTSAAPAIKSVQAKPSVLNANARMSRHHSRFHKRFHKHMGAYKAHNFSKVTVKHVNAAIKRG